MMKGRKRLTLLVVLGTGLAVLAGFGIRWSVRADSSDGKAKAQAVNVRTATVERKTMSSTLRLTGVTSALDFQALVAPKLQGNRRSTAFAGITNAAITSPTASATGTGSSGATSGTSSGTASSSAGGGASTGSDAGGGATGTDATAGGAAAGGSSAGASRGTMSTAMQSSLSRFSGSGSSTTGRSAALSSAGATSTTPSATLGDQGLGSTSSSLSGGSQGPGAIGSASSGGGGGGRGSRSSRFGLTLVTMLEAGTKVKKGDLVAEFDPESMRLQVDDYLAVVRQSEERMRSLREDEQVNRKAHKQLIDIAKANLDKARLDYKTKEVRSAIDTELLKLSVEEAEANYKQLQQEVKFVETSLKAQIRDAELKLLQIRNELQRAQANLDKMVIRAPMDGIVTIFTTWRGGEFGAYKQGDMVGPGSAFVKVVNPDSMIVEAKINQVDIDKVRIGQPAYIKVDGFPDMRLKAKVISIGAITDQGGMSGNFVKQIPLRLQLLEMDPRLVPDLSASVDLVLAERDDLPVVPLSAVFRDQSETGPYVWVREGNEWRRRTVQLGLSSYTHAVVLNGIKEGDVIALERPAAAGGKSS